MGTAVMTCVCSVWVPVVVVGTGLGPVHTQLSPLTTGEAGSRRAIRSSRDLFLKYILNSEHMYISMAHLCTCRHVYTHAHAPMRAPMHVSNTHRSGVCGGVMQELPLGIKY